MGKIKNPYPDPKASKTIYGIIMGETDFKCYAEENLSKIEGFVPTAQDTDRKQGEFVVFNDHVEKCLARNKSQDLFKNIVEGIDYRTQQNPTAYVQYKFKKVQILKDTGRIQMLLNLDLVKGPLYIIC